VTDYYLNNDAVAARLSYDNGVLDGACSFYYENGQLREKGVYAKNARIGVWEYFYDNGAKEKTLRFTDSGVYLIDCFRRDGFVLAQDGNGRFEGRVLTGTASSTTELAMSGPVKDGMPDGEWKLYNKFLLDPLYVEQFASGRFIHGVSKGERVTSEYDQGPFSSVASIETLGALDYYAYDDFCTLAGKNRTMPPGSFDDKPFPEIDKGMTHILKSGKYSDYSGWVLLDIKYDKSGRVATRSVRMYQENEGFRKELVSLLEDMKRPGKLILDGNDTPFERFYVVLVEGNAAVIPEEFLQKSRQIAPFRPK
jgi:antitoxin component YwqK of YwqJK toxin-antitoxin module